MAIVANDGSRLNLKMGQGWRQAILRDYVEKYGADLYPHFLAICREFIEGQSAIHGYSVSHFDGYYCGHLRQMTHYLAILER